MSLQAENYYWSIFCDIYFFLDYLNFCLYTLAELLSLRKTDPGVYKSHHQNPLTLKILNKYTNIHHYSSQHFTFYIPTT